MSTIPQKTFYVYVLARPNGVPFYVGKGMRRRIFDHEREAKNGCRCHKCNVIRKIWRNGGEVQRYTVFTTADEQEAFFRERELIALYGRKTLCNNTDGGEGASGCPKPKTEEHRRKLSEALKGRPLAPHVHKSFIKINIGRKYDERHRENIARGQTGNRTYVAIAIDGTTYSDIGNLRAFEQTHGIPDGGLYEVIIGRCTHADGWVAWVEGEEPKSRPKTYVTIAPDGTRYDHIINVAQFAKEHNIDGHQLRAALRGDHPHAQGWIGWETGKEPEAKPQPPVYTITDPSGMVYRGVVNLRGFARTHGLPETALYRVVSGQHRQYKGWTGYKESR